MMDKGVRLVCGVVGLLSLSLLVGCESGRLVEERDALWTQNEELQKELTSAREERDAALADRDRLSGEVERLQDELEKRQITIAAQPLPANAFRGIEGVETTQTDKRITVRVPGDVLFAPGKTDLKDSARKTLDKIAQVIKSDYPHNKIRIEGYTDTDPIRKSKWADNLELSLERAAAVHRYLQKQGVRPERMEAVGLGEWHPRSSKASSRRVEIIVVLRE